MSLLSVSNHRQRVVYLQSTFFKKEKKILNKSYQLDTKSESTLLIFIDTHKPLEYKKLILCMALLFADFVWLYIIIITQTSIFLVITRQEQLKTQSHILKSSVSQRVLVCANINIWRRKKNYAVSWWMELPLHSTLFLLCWYLQLYNTLIFLYLTCSTLFNCSSSVESDGNDWLTEFFFSKWDHNDNCFWFSGNENVVRFVKKMVTLKHCLI